NLAPNLPSLVWSRPSNLPSLVWSRPSNLPTPVVSRPNFALNLPTPIQTFHICRTTSVQELSICLNCFSFFPCFPTCPTPTDCRFRYPRVQVGPALVQGHYEQAVRPGLSA